MTAHVLGSDTERSQGRLGGFRKFNYAPSLAEAVSIAAGGVPESLRGASEAPFNFSDFSSGAGGYVSLSTTSTWAGNQDGVFGVDDCALYTQTTTDFNSYFNRSSGNGALVAGNLYELSFDAAVTSENENPIFLHLANPGSSADVFEGTDVFELDAIDAWKTYKTILVPSSTTTTGVRWYVTTSASSPIVNRPAVGSRFWIKNIRWKKLGLTASYEPGSIQLAPGQWLDTSGNGKHAYIPDGFRLGAASRSGDLSSVLTWEASSTDPRYVTGVNASAVPANSAVTIYAKADTSGTFDIGDDSNATYYASAVSIGTDWTPITLTNPVNDGTNREIVLTPTSAYAGSVTISAQVQVLV